MYYRQRPRATHILSTAQTMRLFSLVLMMGVIALTIYRTGPWRRPDFQAIAAVDNEPQAEPAQRQVPEKVASEPAEPSPGGKTTADDSAHSNVETSDAPTDQADDQLPPAAPRLEDAETSAADDRNDEERSAFRWETQGMSDQSTLIQGVELPAYRRLFKWITSQSTEDLARRNPPDAVFQQLTQHSDKYRGDLLTLELTVRRVEKDPVAAANPAGVEHVYQLWGWPTSGRGWLYVVVTPELPPGFPEGADVYQTVRVYGYFFKLQGYQPANAKPNARPLVAPLIVGKLVWQPNTPTANPAEQALSLVFLVGGGLIVLCAIGYWFVAARRKKKRLPPPSGEVDWPADREAESYSGHEDDVDADGPLTGNRDNFDWLRE
jgi:hypothetical protein